MGKTNNYSNQGGSDPLQEMLDYSKTPSTSTPLNTDIKLNLDTTLWNWSQPYKKCTKLHQQ